jgi:hypothetical protein
MRDLFLVQAALVAVVGCGSGEKATSARADPVPTAVSCTDAPQLKQRALDDRRLSGEQKGDRAKIIIGSRAKFLASLAIVADLKCRINVAEADALLGKALDAVRAAETPSSEYEAAIRWVEADLIVADAVALLISRLPAPLSR